MRLLSQEKLTALQQTKSCVRNICIMAHVDHGKTTLADSLVASNGIISQRLVGKLRYMDSRKDEQERGITMKSSSITLHHTLGGHDYLVNLVDSPGHVDFSSEVSTAVRLCDGAIIVVDVVEGVCAQTKVVLRQAWEEHIRPILVLNKIDRLITEMRFAPLDAYVHLTQVLEQVNAEVGELFAADVLSKADLKEKKDTLGYDWSSGLEEADDSNLYFVPEEGNVVFASAGDGWGFTVSDFAKLYASKLGVLEEDLEKCIWGDYFYNGKTKTIVPGAQAKAKKPLFVQLVLENIWAAYEAIVIRKDKVMMEKIVNSLSLKIPARDMKHTDPKVQIQAVCSHWLPLSQAVLRMVCEKLPSPEELSEIRALRLMCSQGRNFESYPPETQALKQAFVSGDPSDAAPVIVFISKMFPVERRALPQNKQRPLTAEEIAQRRELARQRLKEREALAMGQGAIQLTETRIADLQKNEGVPSQPSEQPPENLDEDVFVAFARVFSGTLKKGQVLYALGPKYSPTTASLHDTGIDPNMTLKDLKAGQHVTKVTVNDLYLLMGRELESLDAVPAGNVLGIGGLEEHVLKSATLSSTLACPSFSELSFMAVPIVRVAVEPKKPSEMPSLLKGLRLLNQADPCVQVLVQENGEHVLITAGEVHLQRCLQDLRERYAKIDINSSPPIVPFRETIVTPPTLDRVNEAIEEQNQKKEVEVDYVELSTPNKRSTVRIRAAPLPSSIVHILDKNSELLKAVATITSVKTVEISDSMQQLTLSSESTPDENGLKKEGELSPLFLESGKAIDENALLLLNTKTRDEFLELKAELKAAFGREGDQWQGAENYIWAFGPRRYGPNILLNKIPDWDSKTTVWDARNSNTSKAAKASDSRSEFYNSFVNGFQVATLSGPLCEEPLMGVCFIVEDWVVKPEPESCGDTPPTISTSQPYGPFAGQVISMVKEGCRKAFQLQPQRLMAAMYSCVIQVNAEVLGKMYAVLGKRHGQVLAGDMQEGSATFSVTAVLPVVESFDFANEIRKQTSGLASPQLVFSHWEVINEDPFWVPTTEEEIAHFGDKADTENRAQKYMNAVRRRKGLPVHEKVVEFAEKQRTISRKK